MSIKEFIISRHANSCNNLKQEKKGKFSALDRAYELDPGITTFGILSTLIKAHKINDIPEAELNGRQKYKLEEDGNKNVYVSCLLRTWFTALCLYLPDNDNMTLMVSPYLK